MRYDDVVQIRTPTLSDAAEIARIHTSVWRTTYGDSVPDYYTDDASVDRRTAQWSTILDTADPSQNVAVAVHDSSIVGFGHCGLDGDVRKLFSLYVLAEFHGTGVAQRLLDAVLTAEPTELWVAQDNVRAIAFYHRNGFTPDGSTESFPGAPDLLVVRLVRSRSWPR